MTRIRVCSMCGDLGHQSEAADDVAYKVLTALHIDLRKSGGHWRVRVWVCSNCETPIVELYPERMSQSCRRQLLGIHEDELVIGEGDGRK